MTNIPIIQLTLFLAVALISPFVTWKKKFPLLLMGVMGVNIILSLSLLLTVNDASFSVQIGGVHPLLGIELLIDAFAVFFSLFGLILGFIILIFAYQYVEAPLKSAPINSYYGLISLLFFGMVGLLYTNDLFNAYVFIEILSIATCALISMAKTKRSYMAAFRYLMLNELASISFLFGVILIYMVTGTLNITAISTQMGDAYAAYPINIALAVGFMGVGLAIKTAIFPFHVWLPDAYASAIAPSSAILSGIVSKLYMLMLIKVIIRLYGLNVIDSLGAPLVMAAFAILAILMGSVFALGQTHYKRMLAYSSVAQVGILLLALSIRSNAALSAMFFYLISHGFIKAMLFLVGGASDYHLNRRTIVSMQSLGYLMPFTMSALAIGAFAMVGIPGTSGFIAKFQLAQAFNEAGHPLFIGLLILSSTLSALYFYPVVIGGFVRGVDQINVRIEKVPRSMLLSIGLLSVLILTLGFAPGLIAPYIEAAVTAMGVAP